jgi:hypothetical protein
VSGACAGFDVSAVIEGESDMNSVPWFEMPKNMFRHSWELATNSTRYNQTGRNISSSGQRNMWLFRLNARTAFGAEGLAIESREGPRRI